MELRSDGLGGDCIFALGRYFGFGDLGEIKQAALLLLRRCYSDLRVLMVIRGRRKGFLVL